VPPSGSAAEATVSGTANVTPEAPEGIFFPLPSGVPALRAATAGPGDAGPA
jgi:hypothetical protein